MKNGESVDTYEVTLRALSLLNRGMDGIEYEKLAHCIKSLLSEPAPQKRDIVRVLTVMSRIASSDQSSTPVLEWDHEEQKVYVADPFFAFYLKWLSQDNLGWGNVGSA